MYQGGPDICWYISSFMGVSVNYESLTLYFSHIHGLNINLYSNSQEVSTEHMKNLKLLNIRHIDAGREEVCAVVVPTHFLALCVCLFSFSLLWCP